MLSFSKPIESATSSYSDEDPREHEKSSYEQEHGTATEGERPPSLSWMDARKMSSSFNLREEHGIAAEGERPPSLSWIGAREKNLAFDRWEGKHLDHLKIPLSDIKAATDSFSEMQCIGLGGFGAVYKAHISIYDTGRPTTVAIKRIHDRLNEYVKFGFIQEIEVLRSCMHPNIVPLLGFCNEEDEMIMVYEYISNGSLADCLQSNTNLTWAQRIRICLDIARGLDYLHTSTREKDTIIHRDVKSDNILLDDNWTAKICDFGLSKFRGDRLPSTMYTNNIAGTLVYLDPEYSKSGKLKTQSDVYSFGVVMFEIMCGKLAYDNIYNDNGLASMARKCFESGTINDLVDPRLTEAANNGSIIIGGVNQESLNTFTEVAYQCVAETQDHRPKMKAVIQELEKSLILQTNAFQNAYRLEEINLATNMFSDENLVTKGGLGKMYRGRLTVPGKSEQIDVVVRKLDCKCGLGDELETEISVLFSHQHDNIISPIGYCNENENNIVIYKNACHGCLDRHLSSQTLTWLQRLQICRGVARALSCIHCDVIQCDIISSSRILLDEDWEPKIFGFEHSTKYPQSWRHSLVSKKNMTPKNDVYSFGLLLFEVVSSGKRPAADHGVIKEELDGIIYSELGEQMEAQSWVDFRKIIDSCVKEDPADRPTMNQIAKELDNVFQLQWKHEKHEGSTAADEVASSNLQKMERLIKIPLSKILEATNFDEDHFVGRGGYANVYRGEFDVSDLQNMPSVEDESKDELAKRKITVAIKHIFYREDNSGIEGFEKEVALLSTCEHPNIISLIGYCTEAGNMFLVYEYATKGSLSNYFGSERRCNLPWGKRLQICLDVANGIKYLHTKTESKPTIIHRDIKSPNILLNENLTAKLGDFGLSTFHIKKQQGSSVYTDHVAGTSYYTDPEYDTSFKYKTKTDIYSFGVVLFEIMSGKLASNPMYTAQNVKGLAPIARRCFVDETMKELIDPKMIEEDDVDIVTLNRGPNQQSFNAFSRIAYACLAESQADRPTIEVIIDELHNASKLQGETIVLSRFRLEDIMLATSGFSDNVFIGLFEDVMLYKAVLKDFDNKSSLAFKDKNDRPWNKTPINVIIKRISSSEHVKQRLLSEIEMYTLYNHPNIVSLIGFCDEGDENILVYEHSVTKSLDVYLKNVDNMHDFTWTRRLQMCLGIARGLHHLHTNTGNQKGIIHGDICSDNIFLGKNWEPKIAYFGVSEFELGNQDASNRKVYLDPEFEKRNDVLRKVSDVYSLGVVMFEIYCGRPAYDPIYTVKSDKGLAFVARQQFIDGKIKEIIDPRLNPSVDEGIFTPDGGPEPDSLDTFLKIAVDCLEKVGDKRPTMEAVIKELERALNMQENHMKSLQISLKEIELATENFSQQNLLGSGKYWKAYKGKLADAAILAKRWNTEFDDRFKTELQILFMHKHKNIIGLVGYCDEKKEKIMVYEHMPEGSLDKHLNDSKLKWINRLEICVDVATALEYLHGGHKTQKKVVHGNIKSHVVLLNQEWGAKLSNFEFSSLYTDQQDFLDRQKMDIYWFGVILFEILKGSSAWAEKDKGEHFISSVKRDYEEKKVDEMAFERIKNDIVRQSLTAFTDIAYRCLNEDTKMRPEASEVAIQLKKALEYQEDSEIWEPKLPKDYHEIMLLSDSKYHTLKKKDIYQKIIEGIILEKNVWYILLENGMANKMISPRRFIFENNKSHRWISICNRSWTAAKMLDISNLNFAISIDTKFLTPDVEYGVYLVFKFCGPRKFSSKHMYTNLKYRHVTETLHSYFATWRNNEWMMIELHRFVTQKEVASFVFVLDSFSRSYCPSGAIYVEGIAFRALKRMVGQEGMIKNVKGVKQPSTDKERTQRSKIDDKWIQWESNGKKHIMLSATEVFSDSQDPESFRKISSTDSRAEQFQDVLELLGQQVFRIEYMIEMKMLSKYTEYTCYLVFKFSEACKGLHGPVRVRDRLNPKNKEGVIIYLRSPSVLNQHDGFRVPQKRKDGLMEVMVWNFNSMNNKQGNGMNFVPMNLKFITYEGNMSGLTVCGLECRTN